jgi:hypothetical protein
MKSCNFGGRPTDKGISGNFESLWSIVCYASEKGCID